MLWPCMSMLSILPRWRDALSSLQQIRKTMTPSARTNARSCTRTWRRCGRPSTGSRPRSTPARSTWTASSPRCCGANSRAPRLAAPGRDRTAACRHPPVRVVRGQALALDPVGVRVAAFPQEQFGLPLGHHVTGREADRGQAPALQTPGRTPASSWAARSDLPAGRRPSPTITPRKG